jgi:hypothetical protein
MAINFGNPSNNQFTVTNSDGYNDYRGLSGNDTYNVNPGLADELVIRDGDGSDAIVLGEAAISGTRFFTGGVEFTYEVGGKLTILGNMDSFTFVFGGGTDPFDPLAGGTVNTFQQTVEAFGLDFSELGALPTNGGSGVIKNDGTVSGINQGTDFTNIDIDTGNVATSDLVTFNAAGDAFNFMDDALINTNVAISNFSSDDVLSFSNADIEDYAFSTNGEDVVISLNLSENNDSIIVNSITLLGIIDDNEAIIHDQSSFINATGFDPFIS